MNTTTESKELRPSQIKRQELRKLSAVAKMMQAEGMKCEGMRINEILIDEFYTNAENTTFKTLHEWSKEGMSVKKGSKSFVVWGIPKAKQSENPPTEDDEEGDFYPLCYLFSNAQVQARESK